jgi:hypothetical protein
VLTGPFSPLFGPFFRAKRAGPARLGPLRAELGKKIKPADTAGPARFLAGLHRARPGPGGPFGHLYLSASTTQNQSGRCFVSGGWGKEKKDAFFFLECLLRCAIHPDERARTWIDGGRSGERGAN